VIIVTSSFPKSSVLKMFSVQTKTHAKSALSNSSGMKRVFEKLCFRDGLVWTVALTVETELRFPIRPAQCGRGLDSHLQLNFGTQQKSIVDLLENTERKCQPVS